jgi:hypothetical protein
MCRIIALKHHHHHTPLTQPRPKSQTSPSTTMMMRITTPRSIYMSASADTVAIFSLLSLSSSVRNACSPIESQSYHLPLHAMRKAAWELLAFLHAGAYLVAVWMNTVCAHVHYGFMDRLKTGWCGNKFTECRAWD